MYFFYLVFYVYEYAVSFLTSYQHFSTASDRTRNSKNKKDEYRKWVYTIDIIFPKDKVFEDMEVVEISNDQQYDIVIGMDIIKMGDIAITHINGKMIFSFRMPPAGKYIDFEYELLKEKYPDEDIEMLYP